MEKKLKFLLRDMDMRKKVLLHYHKEGKIIPRIRKIFPVINDITEEMKNLIIEWFPKTENLPEFNIINNEYINIGKSTQRIGKFMGRKLGELKYKLFNKEYSLLMGKAKQTGTLIISNKLTDMLCASNITHGWNSCQAFDYGDSCRAVANLIYYLSSNAYIAVVEDEFGKKVFRQWITLANAYEGEKIDAIKKGVVVFGRPYPNDNFLLENYIRQMFMENVMKINKHIKKLYKGDIFNLESYRVQDIDYVPYNDIEHGSNVVTFLKYIPEEIYKIIIPLGDLESKIDLKCLYCGDSISDITDFYGNGSCGCVEPEGMYSCNNCGDRLHEDDVYWAFDEPYCRSCFNDSFTNCYNCGDTLNNEDAIIGANNFYYCKSCWGEKFFSCDGCSEVEYFSNFHEVDGNFYCESCYNDKYNTCEECGEVAENETLTDGLCEVCYQKAKEKECNI